VIARFTIRFDDDFATGISADAGNSVASVGFDDSSDRLNTDAMGAALSGRRVT
jgi:hypothetical protein